MTGKRVLRKREVLERLGIRKTSLYESLIKTGKLRFVKIGARAVGVIEDELDALIEELRRERDQGPRVAGLVKERTPTIIGPGRYVASGAPPRQQATVRCAGPASRASLIW